MTQIIIRRLAPLLLLLSLATALPVLAKEEQIYTIKPGDTLWGLSQRFIADPYYWPNIWANNPDISNPHLIFPGQKVRVIDGRLQIIPAYPEAKQPATEEAAPARVPLQENEVITISSTGSGDGFILTDEQPLGTLVDSVDNRVLLTKNDLVFLQMANAAEVSVGDTYGLFRRGDQVMHPTTGKPVGTMMNNLGFLQITGTENGTIIAKIGDVFREISRGAELFEYVPPRKELTLKQGKTDLQGVIVATRDEKLILGSTDVIFIDQGSDNGLLPGNLCYISRPRKVSDEISKKVGELTLPDEVLGAAVIIETRPENASAIIIKSTDAMYIGDKVSVATN